MKLNRLWVYFKLRAYVHKKICYDFVKAHSKENNEQGIVSNYITIGTRSCHGKR